MRQAPRVSADPGHPGYGEEYILGKKVARRGVEGCAAAVRGIACGHPRAVSDSQKEVKLDRVETMDIGAD